MCIGHVKPDVYAPAGTQQATFGDWAILPALVAYVARLHRHFTAYPQSQQEPDCTLAVRCLCIPACLAASGSPNLSAAAAWRPERWHASDLERSMYMRDFKRDKKWIAFLRSILNPREDFNYIAKLTR